MSCLSFLSHEKWLFAKLLYQLIIILLFIICKSKSFFKKVVYLFQRVTERERQMSMVADPGVGRR